MLASPRFLVYVCCASLTVLTAYRSGKDMQWDTLDYHFYAGFSALHDRFGLDYFAASPQAYLNPYIYAPFYLLAVSGLSALEVAAILAVLQSAILWLTYELAVAVAPTESERSRVAIGACAALLAFVNPVLLGQLGSSFADITTAEVALAGSLLLLAATRSGSSWRVIGAGLLLGAASALKLTNALAAVSLSAMLLFPPVRWPRRLGLLATYALAGGIGFALLSAPWSFELERHMGSPLFPLLNNVFRSPQFTTAPILDYRFIPTSLAAALWRPFAMVQPPHLLDFEMLAPDIRYAVLAVAGAVALLWGWRRRPGSGRRAAQAAADEARMLGALACAFVVGWVIWLAESGNSRYFIPMACIAAVLDVALVFRLLRRWPGVRAGVIAAILVAQIYQVQSGTVYRLPLPWEGKPWFDVSVPRPLASDRALYFSVGVQSNSFVVPYLAPGSAFVNLEGDYVLGTEGANGAHLRRLIRRFTPHLRVLVEDSRVNADRATDVPHLPNVDDALAPFGLRVDPGACERIIVPRAPTTQFVTAGDALPRMPQTRWYTRYLVTCRLSPDGAGFGAPLPGERSANLVLDRLEDACPRLFQPRRPVAYLVGDAAHGGYFWVRRYSNTDVAAWVHDGNVAFQKMLGGGRAQNAGAERAWERAPLKVVCRRQGASDYLRLIGTGK